MFSLVIGLVLLAVGITFLYILPEFIITTLNDTSSFDSDALATALTKISTIRGVGFAVIIIGIVWLIVSQVAGLGGKK